MKQQDELTRSDSRLNQIQDRGVEFLKSHNKAIINVGTGVGKTKLVLDYLASLDHYRAVVLVPKSIILQWKDQVSQYWGIDSLKAFKSKPTFFEIYHDGGYLLVLSQHSSHKHLGDILEADILIVDEPKLLKSETKLAALLNDPQVLGAAKQVILLDATVLENKREDVYNLCDLMGVARGDFKDLLFAPEVPRIRPICRKVVRIPLNQKERNLEAFLEHTLMQHLNNGNKSGIYTGIQNLLRYLSSMEYDFDPGWAKLEILKRIINAHHRHESGIIFTRSLDVMRKVHKYLCDDGYEAAYFCGELSARSRNDIMSKFNNGTIQWIVSTTAGMKWS